MNCIKKIKNLQFAIRARAECTTFEAIRANKSIGLQEDKYT